MMGQHAHLAAVMRIVRNHVRQHRGIRRPRLRPPIAAECVDSAAGSRQSGRQHVAAACGTFSQSRPSLLLRASRVVERGRELQMRRRQPQPFPADIVNVREDGGDSPSPASGQFRAPCRGIEVLEHDLIHAFVNRVTLHEHLARVNVWISL
jgi:hypothetical protein